ncbi:MAG: hypothetical protein H6737_14660 [Alphaproteobacteria bacterium]|nr:hypothetical protein [Alphaproteobacteria bacterium]
MTRTRRAWRASAELREDVLLQLRDRERDASLAPLVLDGRPVPVLQPGDVGAVADALGWPEALLHLGLALFQGFPFDTVGIREHVAEVRRLLVAARVGADLEGLIVDFAVWRLSDPTSGWPGRSPDVTALVGRVALALLDGAGDALFPEILATRGRPRARDLAPEGLEALHADHGALDLAAAAIRCRTDPAAASGLAVVHPDRTGLPYLPPDDALLHAARDQLLLQVGRASP